MNTRRLSSQPSQHTIPGAIVAFASRRLATVVVGTALAAVSGLAGQLGIAAAADPITNQPAPTLTGPADNTSTAVKDVVLSWKPVTYATKYQIQISPNGDWTNNVVTLPNNNRTVNTSYEVPVSLPHDEYFWRVRAFDSAGHTAWSSSRSFFHDWSAPWSMVKTPTAGDPSLAWTPVPEASIYQVRYSTDATFSDQPGHTGSCLTVNTSFTPYTLQSDPAKEKIDPTCVTATDLANTQHYFWEVIAYDDSTAPAIQSDTTNDTKWQCGQAQPECNAIQQSGEFTYSAPLAGSTSAGSVTGLATTWHTTSLPGTDCTGGECAMTPTFSWTPVAGANYYRVHVYRDAFGTNTYRVYDTQWPSVTPRDAFFDAQATHGYYWTVEADTCANSGTDATCGTPTLTGDSAGGGGSGGGSSSGPVITSVAFSSVETFGKSSGNVPLTGPAQGTTTTGRGVTFSWGGFQANGGQDAYDARNYHLQVAKDRQFDSIVWDVATIDMTRYTSPTKVLRDGQYFWRVQPIDQSGNGLTWSATRSFTKDGAAPVFRVTDKNGTAANGHVHVSVSESDLVGKVSQSTLHVVPVTGSAAAVAGSWAKTSDRTWTFTPSSPLVVGQSYGLVVVGGLTDVPGNRAIANSSSVRTTTLADNTSPAWRFSGGWTRHSSSNAVHGTYAAGRSGATASLKVVGNSIAVYGCKGPSFGSLKVQVDGSTKTTASEHQSFTKCGLLLWKGTVSRTSVHTVKVTTSGSGALDAVRVG
jgi:hypothetical protein